ncbi:hypothetical protein OSH04_18190 [Alcaligenes sp. A-TC2]|uniref:hypothetical protein n=1 Tax=Alcaligenes nematophilus TaxID=2994643 RepID=UPI002259E68B|nr:hypothetical protein [Alcaligenes nematophilus]MCX5473656.1 hypothetical protein [Alcaligenes nematophilus]
MKLDEMSMKDLMVLHNKIADKPAGPKTFATRGKLVARIESIAADKNLDLASFGRPQTPEAAVPSAQPQAEATESPDAQPETVTPPRGKGIGALAWQLLMDPAGYPHRLIAAMVNAQLDGAQATDKSVRWYANDMRKKGIEVPPRQKAHPADMDEEQSIEAMKTVRVVEPAADD